MSSDPGVTRNLEVRLVPVYMAAQYLGALLASAVLWAEYHGVIILAEQTILVNKNSSEPATYTAATHGIFASYPFFDTDKVCALFGSVRSSRSHNLSPSVRFKFV